LETKGHASRYLNAFGSLEDMLAAARTPFAGMAVD
jgi:hypothetical protein